MPTTFLLLLVVSVFSFCANSFAISSESYREAVVSPRSKKFYKSNSTKQYLSLGGNYSSDQDSKDYQLTTRYFYQNNNFVHEANFLKEDNYSNAGTAAGKTYLVKDSELYDFSLSSKARIKDSKNYGVFFHRTIYDDLSKYYYDLHTAVGAGRKFFNDKIELDLSLGYQDVKEYGYKMDVVSSIRTNLKLTNKLTLIQRGYWFIEPESFDNELKTSLIYRLGPKTSFEIRHNFEQRRYEDDTAKKRAVINQVSRSITIGMVFDLE